MSCNTCEIEKLSQEVEECILSHVVHRLAESWLYSLNSIYFISISVGTWTFHIHAEVIFIHGVNSDRSFAFVELLVESACRLMMERQGGKKQKLI